MTEQPTPTEDVAGLVERLNRYAVNSDIARHHPTGWELLHEAAQALTALAGRVEEVERERDDINAHFRSLTGFAPWLWADPAADSPDEYIDRAEERVRLPTVLAQPFTPSQYALVLRWDLITLRHELISNRARADMWRDKFNAAESHVQALIAGQREITWQDVRLAVGEGKLSASDVLAGCNAELRRRAALNASAPTEGGLRAESQSQPCVAREPS